MAEELTPSQQATVERFGIFEPEEDDSFWEAIQAQRDPGPWVKLPTREAVLAFLQAEWDEVPYEDEWAEKATDALLAFLSEAVS